MNEAALGPPTRPLEIEEAEGLIIGLPLTMAVPSDQAKDGTMAGITSLGSV